MKVTCPTCGRGTLLDTEIGDFPTRCQRCGGLLRKPPVEGAAGPTGLIKGLSLRRADPPGASSARIARGTLAGMLSARSTAEFDSLATNGVSSAATAIAEFPSSSELASDSATALAEPPAPPPPPESQQVVLRPESRREIARVAARQKALRRAQLRGNLQALGALGWLGLIVIGILVVSALVLQAHAMWQHS